MTTPVNVASDNARVGMQSQTTFIDSVTLPGEVQLMMGEDASPASRYRVGVNNLKHGNSRAAREHIWKAMTGDFDVTSEVLFHWLVAMISGRTARQFSTDETAQLKQFRYRCPETAGDAWAEGARLIYRLLDSVLLPLSADAEPRAAKTNTSLLVEQFDDLEEKQRDMIQPHLEFFLSGHIQDEMWQRELETAQKRQYSGGRLGRAWMFFQPIPARVTLPRPRPERISTGDRLTMRACAGLLVAAAVYLSWALLWHGVLLGLPGVAAALAGGSVAAVKDLDQRSVAERRRLLDERFRVPASTPPGDELTDAVDKLFNRYFNGSQYVPEKADRERWRTAVAGFRRFYRDEIIQVCRGSGHPANSVGWLIRFEVRQLRDRWLAGTLHDYRGRLVPKRGTVAAARAGLAVSFLGVVWTVISLRSYPLADIAGTLVALPSAVLTWRCWLRLNLERGRYAADADEHAQRQMAIDKEFSRWSAILEARPKDAQMAAWLQCDRTVLLGRALDHFQLLRSRLKAYAFIETPGVAVRRAQVQGGPWRYSEYRLLVLLLAEDGVRQVRANLVFMKGTLTIRERISYRYDAIVSVHVVREARREKFELRLTAGDPITLRVRDVDPGEPQQDQGESQQDQDASPEEDTALDVTSMADLLYMLEGVAGEGQQWFQEREWAGSW
jgi:hypothetical protein